MPYTVALPDGRTVEFPDSVSREDAAAIIRRQFGGGAAPKESTVLGEIARGGKQLVSTTRTGIGALISPEEAARAGVERSQQIAAEAGEGPSLAALRKAYEERGLLPAAGELISQIPRAVAGQLPQLAALAGGAKAGAMAGTAAAPFLGPAAPIAPVVGGVLGAGASLLPQFFGANVERQAAEQMERGEPVSIDRTSAAAAAAGQAGIEAAGTAFVLGKRVVKGLLGVTDDAALATAKARDELVKAAARSRLGAAGRGAAAGLAEIPVEIAQAVIERAQAGLDVLSPEAISEYGENAYLAGLVGPTIGAATRVTEPGAARKKLAIEEQAKAAEERKATAAAEEAKKQSPEYLLDLEQRYKDALAKKQELDAAAKPPKKEEAADPAVKIAHRDAVRARDEFAKTEMAAVAREYASRKKDIDALNAQRQQEAETAAAREVPQAEQKLPFYESAQATIPGLEAVEAPAAAEETTAPVDYAAQVRNLRNYLDGLRERAQGTTDLDAKLRLGEEYTRVQTALKEAEKETKAEGQGAEKRVESLRRKMFVAEEQEDIDAQVSIAKELKALGVTDLAQPAGQPELPGMQTNFFAPSEVAKRKDADLTARAEATSAARPDLVAPVEETDPLEMWKASVAETEEQATEELLRPNFETLGPSGPATVAVPTNITPIQNPSTLLKRLDTLTATRDQAAADADSAFASGNRELGIKKSQEREAAQTALNNLEQMEGAPRALMALRKAQDTALMNAAQLIDDLKAGRTLGGPEAGTASSTPQTLINQINKQRDAFITAMVQEAATNRRLFGKALPQKEATKAADQARSVFNEWVTRSMAQPVKAVNWTDRMLAYMQAEDAVQGAYILDRPWVQQMKQDFIRAQMTDALTQRLGRQRMEEIAKGTAELKGAETELPADTRRAIESKASVDFNRLLVDAQKKAFAQSTDPRPLEERRFGAYRAATQVLQEQLQAIASKLKQVPRAPQRVEPTLKMQFPETEAAKVAEAKGETAQTLEGALRRRRDYVSTLIEQAFQTRKVPGIAETLLTRAQDFLPRGTTGLLDAAENIADRIVRGQNIERSDLVALRDELRAASARPGEAEVVGEREGQAELFPKETRRVELGVIRETRRNFENAPIVKRARAAAARAQELLGQIKTAWDAADVAKEKVRKKKLAKAEAAVEQQREEYRDAFNAALEKAKVTDLTNKFQPQIDAVINQLAILGKERAKALRAKEKDVAEDLETIIEVERENLQNLRQQLADALKSPSKAVEPAEMRGKKQMRGFTQPYEVAAAADDWVRFERDALTKAEAKLARLKGADKAPQVRAVAEQRAAVKTAEDITQRAAVKTAEDITQRARTGLGLPGIRVERQAVAAEIAALAERIPKIKDPKKKRKAEERLARLEMTRREAPEEIKPSSEVADERAARAAEERKAEREAAEARRKEKETERSQLEDRALTLASEIEDLRDARERARTPASKERIQGQIDERSKEVMLLQSQLETPDLTRTEKRKARKAQKTLYSSKGVNSEKELLTSIAQKLQDKKPLSAYEKRIWEGRVTPKTGLSAKGKQTLSEASEALRRERKEAERPAGTFGETLGVEDVLSSFNVGGKDTFFSRGATANPSTTASVRTELSKAFPNLGRVQIYDSVDALLKANPQYEGKIPSDARGFVDTAGNKAFLIAENIDQGQALSVLLHEVGAHIGLKNMLGDAQYNALVNAVKSWEKRTDNSTEAKVAKAARARVEAAETTAGQVNDELLAYTIEEAVNAGVKPTETKGVLGQWLSRVAALFRKALEKFGLPPKTLDAQGIVDMAFGAAKMEMRPAVPQMSRRQFLRGAGAALGAMKLPQLPKEAQIDALEAAWEGSIEAARTWFDTAEVAAKTPALKALIRANNFFDIDKENVATALYNTSEDLYNHMHYLDYGSLATEEEYRYWTRSYLEEKGVKAVAELQSALKDLYGKILTEAKGTKAPEVGELFFSEIARLDSRRNIFKDADVRAVFLKWDKNRLNDLSEYGFGALRSEAPQRHVMQKYLTKKDLIEADRVAERTEGSNQDKKNAYKNYLNEAMEARSGGTVWEELKAYRENMPSAVEMFAATEEGQEMARSVKEGVDRENRERVEARRSTFKVVDRDVLFSRNLPTASRVAGQLIASQPSEFKRLKDNFFGWGLRAQFVDKLDSLLKAFKLGGVEDLKATQAMYYMRMYDQRMHFTSQAITEGAPEVAEKTRKDGRTERIIETKAGANIGQVVNILKRKDVVKAAGSADAANKLFTLYMAAIRGERVGYDKLNFGRTWAQAEIGRIESQLASGRISPEERTNLQTRKRKLEEKLSSLPTEADIKAAKAEIEANATLKNAFDEARDIYNQYNRNLLDFAVQTGAMAKDLANRLLAQNDYIPYYRMREGVAELVIGNETPIRIGNLKDSPHLKELVGGDEAIFDFLTSSVQNTSMLLDMSLKNLATKNAMFELSEVGLAKIGKVTKKSAAPEGSVTFKKDGEDYFAIVDTDAIGVNSELLVKGMAGIPTMFPSFVRVLGIPARFLRRTIVASPVYMARQLFRDTTAAAIASGADIVPVLGALRQLGKPGALKGRGITGGQTLTGMPEDMTRILKDMQSGKISLNGGLAWLEAQSAKVDAATRENQYNSYIAQGLSEMEATYMALESMNFSKRGLSPTLHMVSTLIPFFNAQIQGLDVLYKAFTKQMPMNERLAIRDKLWTRGMMLAGLSFAYAMAMQDDETYQNAKPEEKYGNWFVKVPGFDQMVRLPIPFELGYIFKALPEAIVNTLSNEEGGAEAAKALKHIVQQMIPGASSYFMPAAIKPALEVAMGTSMYTGRGIESAEEQAQEPGYRYRDNTTELARQVGELTGFSPIKMEYLVRGYTGGMGMALLQMLSAPFGSTGPEAAAKRLSDLPVVGTLFQPNDASGIINAAYERINEINRVKETYEGLLKKGRIEDARKYLDENVNEMALASVAGSFKQYMGEITKYEGAIRAAPGMTGEEKREKLDQLRQVKINLAKAVRGIVDKKEPQAAPA